MLEISFQAVIPNKDWLASETIARLLLQVMIAIRFA